MLGLVALFGPLGLFLGLGSSSKTFLGPTCIGGGGWLDIAILMQTKSLALTLTSTDEFGFVKKKCQEFAFNI